MWMVPEHLDEALDDGQAEPRPAVLARARRVDLIEGVEHARLLLRRDADAGVLDAHLDHRPRRREQRQSLGLGLLPVVLHHAGAQRDGASCGRELDRVLDEVDEHLTQPLRIAAQVHETAAELEGQRHALLAGRGGERRHDLPEDRLDADGADLHAHGPALQLAEIEQPHDEREELLALLVNRLHEHLLLGFELAGEPLPEHLAVSDDRRERRAKLVAHRRQEVRLEAIELLRAGRTPPGGAPSSPRAAGSPPRTLARCMVP